MTGVIFSLCFLTGCVLLASSLRLRSLARQAPHWPRVAGRVVESRVDDAHLEFMKPVLRYRYAVDGVDYTGFRVAFSGYGISKVAMQKLIAPYALGSAVLVSYDPSQPSRAVLDTTARSDWAYWFVAGLCFIALGLYLLRL